MSGAGRGEDRIQELLRATGRRLPPPPERAERVEASVREHWRASVRWQRRRRWAWMAAAAAIAATGVLLLGERTRRKPPAPPLVAGSVRVEVIADGAWRRPSSAASPVALAVGDTIAPGSELATEGGRLALRLPGGPSVRLDAGTRLRLREDGGLHLERGAVYVDTRDRDGSVGSAGGVTVVTPLGRVRDLGTQFEARCAGDSLLLRVREGAVTLEGAASVALSAGQEAAIAPGGEVRRRALAGSDPSWSWAADVAPPLDLEGRTLKAFLEWVAREKGLRLRFATPDAEQAAARTVLSGSIEGLTLDQALASVLPTARMEGRVVNGMLVVSP